MSQLALIALVLLGYTLIAVRLERLSITAPMLLVTVGAILGPAALGAVSAPATSEPVQLLTELTLALLLFTDASTIGLRQAGSIARIPGRLLAIGLPLSIVAGAIVGWLLFRELGIAVALLMGSILAPTDAALSLPVLLNRAIPTRVRRVINVESGLNDGIASPFVALFVTFSIAESAGGGQNWLIEAALQIGLAVAVAIVVGGFGGWILLNAMRRGWASSASESFAVVALAMLAYTGATAIGGNGFVAAFVAGIAFRTATERSEPSVEFAESIGLAGSYLVWLIFGVALVGPVLVAGFDPVYVLYAALSLTVVRMVPVALSLVGTGLRTDTTTFIGWFGPRGLASAVFLLVALEELGPAHPATVVLVQAVTWTILLSIFLHGITARPLGALYARRMATAPPDAWELADEEAPDLRHRHVLAQPAGGES